MTGDLNRDYFESKNKEEFDWEKTANKYRTKLNDEFVKEYILKARVQALQMLIATNDKFWPDYIKYNIELKETYSMDTSKCIR